MASSRELQYRGGTTHIGSKLQEGGWRHPGEMERPPTTCRDPIAWHKWDGKSSQFLSVSMDVLIATSGGLGNTQLKFGLG